MLSSALQQITRQMASGLELQVVLASTTQELVEVMNTDKPQEFDFNEGHQEVHDNEPSGRDLLV
ncbi:MAG: hypothetical protein KF778_22695 [Rhodocyclaceae bacterium]|nr:hypothetical protein [Rhodocyclaceae bacterium]